MPPVAKVQKRPSDYVLRETLRQLETVPINLLGDRLGWLLKVWPGCAILVVRDSDRLERRHCDAVRRWGEHNLWQGNYDPSGLEDPPDGGGAGGSGSAGTSHS